MELKICHLFPDILNLYGDRGNVVCMRRRLGWRGIDVSVSEVSIGTALKASDYDLFFIGGGQDFEQEVLLEDLKGGKTAEIKAAIEDGKTFLAICGGYQMLGAYYKTWDGQQCDFTAETGGVPALFGDLSEGRIVGKCAYIGKLFVAHLDGLPEDPVSGSVCKSFGIVDRFRDGISGNIESVGNVLDRYLFFHFSYSLVCK